MSQKKYTLEKIVGGHARVNNLHMYTVVVQETKFADYDAQK